METKTRTPVIWLHGLECTCCTESFIRSAHPLAKDVVLSMISLDYDDTLMAAAGHQAEVVGIVEARDRPHAIDAGGGNLILDGLGQRRRQIGYRHADRLDLGPCGDCAEPLGDLGLGSGKVNVAGQDQDRVVRAIVIAEPLLHVFQAGTAEVRHRADGRVVIGVA